MASPGREHPAATVWVKVKQELARCGSDSTWQGEPGEHKTEVVGLYAGNEPTLQVWNTMTDDSNPVLEIIAGPYQTNETARRQKTYHGDVATDQANGFDVADVSRLYGYVLSDNARLSAPYFKSLAKRASQGHRHI